MKRSVMVGLVAVAVLLGGCSDEKGDKGSSDEEDTEALKRRVAELEKTVEKQNLKKKIAVFIVHTVM